jgi:hypothetical protein
MAAVVPNDGDAGGAAAQGNVREHVAARSLRSVLVSIRLEYPGTWQPAWNNRDQDLGHPLASSGAGWIGPETDAGHALLMQALKRMSIPVAKKHPLTARMLRGIFGLLDMSQSGHQLVSGLLSIGYFLLRHVEFLKVDGKWEKYVLLYGDAQFYDENEEHCKVQHAAMVGIVLRGGKNNQFGRNEIRYQFATETRCCARCVG